jgi:hypothetical protein
MYFQSSCKSSQNSPRGTIHMSLGFCRKTPGFSRIVTRGPSRELNRGGSPKLAALVGGGHIGGEEDAGKHRDARAHPQVASARPGVCWAFLTSLPKVDLVF